MHIGSSLKYARILRKVLSLSTSGCHLHWLGKGGLEQARIMRVPHCAARLSASWCLVLVFLVTLLFQARLIRVLQLCLRHALEAWGWLSTALSG